MEIGHLYHYPTLQHKCKKEQIYTVPCVYELQPSSTKNRVYPGNGRMLLVSSGIFLSDYEQRAFNAMLELFPGFKSSSHERQDERDNLESHCWVDLSSANNFLQGIVYN